MRMVRWLVITGLLVAVVGGTGGPVAAEPACLSETKNDLRCMPGPKTLEERLEELEQKMRDADRLRELEQQPGAVDERCAGGGSQSGWLFLAIGRPGIRAAIQRICASAGPVLFWRHGTIERHGFFRDPAFPTNPRRDSAPLYQVPAYAGFWLGASEAVYRNYRLRLLDGTPLSDGEIQSAGGVGKASVRGRHGVYRARSADESRSEPGHWGATLWRSV